MFDARKVKALLAVVEMLGLVGLGFGPIMILIAFATGEISPLIGLWILASGFSSLLAAQMGRAIVHIAETNSAILQKLSGKE